VKVNCATSSTRTPCIGSEVKRSSWFLDARSVSRIGGARQPRAGDNRGAKGEQSA
jgi:hypothetical protein